jgi:cyanophycinase
MIRTRLFARLVLAAVFTALSLATALGQTPGPLVVVGGGTLDPAIVARTIQLAGGSRAVVAILPQASASAAAGDSGVALWLKAGARKARKVDFAERAEALDAIQKASLIWMPGGQQSRFMDAIAGTGLDDAIRAARNRGAVVAGTSAGAAVMSTVMITGDADLKNIKAGGTVTRDGLGLWPDVVVDQHFLQRQRNNRLLSLVLERPSLIGIGIDESTAVISTGTTIEVIGKSSAVVMDARGATPATTAKGEVAAGTGLSLHVLRAGMSMELK